MRAPILYGVWASGRVERMRSSMKRMHTCNDSTKGEEEDTDEHGAIVWGVGNSLHETKVSDEGFMGQSQ